MNNPSWYMAVEYCRWLTRQAGMSEADQCYQDRKPGAERPDWSFHPERPGFRLPTEAEWEYACRAGTVTMYHFGSDRSNLGHYAWYLDNAGPRSGPVRTKRPNGRGLFDMQGNVSEWCADWAAKYSERQTVDPLGPERGVNRVFRGGTWFLTALPCRSAYRMHSPPADRFTFLGLRVVRTLPPMKGNP